MAERIRTGAEKLTITLANDELNFMICIGAGEKRGGDGSAPLIDRVKRAVAITSSRGGNQIVASDGDSFDHMAFDKPSRKLRQASASSMHSPRTRIPRTVLKSDQPTSRHPKESTSWGV